MLRLNSFVILLIMCMVSLVTAQREQVWRDFIGSAYLDNAGYEVLGHISDQFGGRIAGSEADRKTLDFLTQKISQMGVEVRREKFEMPGWQRGEDRVEMIRPINRLLSAKALGYVDAHASFEADLLYAGLGNRDDFENRDVKNKLVLVSGERVKNKTMPLRSEVISFAADAGAKGVLFINNKSGFLNLVGTSNFQGKAAGVPAYTLTREEGLWLKRLLEGGQTLTIKMETRSKCMPAKTANLMATLPGKVADKIVVGAHIDSWDLGQGSIDNGLGSAILFDVLRLFKTYHPQNYYTIEFVWINGEELGLWGAKEYVKQHQKENILAMINMDMTGKPTGFNQMGRSELLPFFEKLVEKLGVFELSRGIINQPWTNSDHQPFMLAGIPTVTSTAHLDEEMVKYYHSAGDTFDKVSKKYLSDAAAIMGILTLEMANNPDIPLKRQSEAETAEMLKQFNLEDRLKRQGEWKFD